MSNQKNPQPKLRQQAGDILSRLPTSEREALLIKCWMSHDARWFMAVANECGMEVTNRLNQIAAYELGQVEAKRLVQALQLPLPTTPAEYLLIQEILIGLFGPDLIDYQVSRVDDNGYQIQIQRCFAHENVERAGIADHYDCGIFARITGWLNALGLTYKIIPPLGKCLKAQEQACTYRITLER